MGSSRVVRRVVISVSTVLLLLLSPLIFAFSVAVGVLGVLIVSVVVLVAGLAPFLNEKQRISRNRRAKLVADATPYTEKIAEELGVPLVRSIRAPDEPLDVIVRVTEGGCPLMREVGDVFQVGANGQLSSPLCSPSAAAVQRLIRRDGVHSGTSEHCVCPVGDYELTFALDAA
jgi:hypothetical protein